MRNRWRRHRLDPTLKDEVVPKNILMIGPTGVGKTEIARRLAKIAAAPFIKVEATKFTEVGFHGRDVDQIIKDLVEESLNMVRNRRRSSMKERINAQVEETILKALVGDNQKDKQTFRESLRKGALDDQSIELDIPARDEANSHLILLPTQPPVFRLAPSRGEKKKMKINECRPLLEEMETEKLISTDDMVKEAIKLVEEDGIVFIDEIDKICNPSHQRHGPDASAEGVQRDLLPLIEGCSYRPNMGMSTLITFCLLPLEHSIIVSPPIC